MSKIIALANQKGGVGKTTTAINLAASLGESGQKILLIDLDPQGNSTMGTGIDKNQIIHSTNEVILRDCSASDAILITACGYDLIPANKDLTIAEIGLIKLDNKEKYLKDALYDVANKYDFILIDCPPALNTLTINALVAANSVIIPMQCEYYAMEGLAALVGTIYQIKSSVNKHLKIEGILRTMYDGRNRLCQEVSRELLNHFKHEVYRTVIPRNVRLAEAPSHGLPVMLYDKASSGAAAYMVLAAEILSKQKSIDTVKG